MNLWQQLYQLLAQGQRAMLVSVLAASGSTPRGLGACMVLTQDGKSVGTIGGGNVEYQAQQKGAVLLKEGGNDIDSFRFVQGDAASLGMVCGGSLTVHFHALTPSDLPSLAGLDQTREDCWLVRKLDGAQVSEMSVATRETLQNPILLGKDGGVDGPWLSIPVVQLRRVIVFGGGHVSQALVPMLAAVGYAPVVYDDRPEFTDKALFNGIHDAICGDFNTISSRISVNSADAVVIMTRGHQADYEALTQTLDKGCWYVGCIGSKTKLAVSRGRLLADGYTDEVIQSVHAPIGLPLGGRTPAEIAVAVTAELIAVEHGNRGLFAVKE